MFGKKKTTKDACKCEVGDSQNNSTSNCTNTKSCGNSSNKTTKSCASSRSTKSCSAKTNASTTGKTRSVKNCK